MITKWKIKNFKSIRNEEELEMRPLTIFTGANSSGKSTIIQSILLIAQTIIHKQIAFQSVVINGTLVGLGQFDDIKNDRSKSRDIKVKCTCRPLKNRFGGRLRRPIYYGSRYIRFNEISCDITFSSHKSHLPKDLAQVRPHILSSRISCNYNDISDQPQHYSRANRKLDLYNAESKDSDSKNAYMSINNFSNPNNQLSKDLRKYGRDTLACDIKFDRNSMKEIRRVHSTADPIGCIIDHFIPKSILCNIDELTESAENISSILYENFTRSRY